MKITYSCSRCVAYWICDSGPRRSKMCVDFHNALEKKFTVRKAKQQPKHATKSRHRNAGNAAAMQILFGDDRG